MAKNLSDYEYPLFTDDFEGMTPKGEGGGGGGVLICTDTSDTLDKTMGEIQEALTNGTLTYIKVGNKSCMVTFLDPVVYESVDHKYFGYLAAYDYGQNVPLVYKVEETTESAALAAYPMFVPF